MLHWCKSSITNTVRKPGHCLPADHFQRLLLRFQSHDEWTLAQSLPRQQLEPILRKHYAEWIIEDDFAKMRDYGINAVRIPIPHWTFGTEGDEPYLQLNQ